MKHPASALPAFLLGLASVAAAAEPATRPNIVYILADDLGYGDLGCYGQTVLQTPNIDRLAAEGVRFTQHYAASSVCEPSRSSLLTGKHPGHVRHRALLRFVNNIGFKPEDVTFAEVMKTAGYATAIAGKWHLGDRADTDGPPHNHGFDFAYCVGYPYPAGGIEHWPSHVFVNGRQMPIAENEGGKQVRYMDDLYTDAALQFIREHRDGPFLVYLSLQSPHAPMDGKIAAKYADQPWPEVEKRFASMVDSADQNVGRVMATLRSLGLDQNTVVFFSSDNGPHAEGGHDPEFFRSRGLLRGIKRFLYEGGIRVPFIARWPGMIAPGTASDHVSAFWDMLPTFAELGGAALPAKTDGLSLVPTLRARPQPAHPWLYWEILKETGTKPGDNGKSAQAVRLGSWKGVRIGVDRDSKVPFELYNLAADPAELHDVAATHPDIVARLMAIVAEAHVTSEEFPLYPEERAAKAAAAGARP